MNEFSLYKRTKARRVVLLLGIVFALFMLNCNYARASAETVAAMKSVRQAHKTVEPALGTASAVAEVPFAAAEVLKLPLGVIQTALFPLPGISLSSGLRNLGAGLTAPFKFAGTVLKLPFEVISQAGKIGGD